MSKFLFYFIGILYYITDTDRIIINNKLSMFPVVTFGLNIHVDEG